MIEITTGTETTDRDNCLGPPLKTAAASKVCSAFSKVIPKFTFVPILCHPDRPRTSAASEWEWKDPDTASSTTKVQGVLSKR